MPSPIVLFKVFTACVAVTNTTPKPREISLLVQSVGMSPNQSQKATLSCASNEEKWNPESPQRTKTKGKNI